MSNKTLKIDPTLFSFNKKQKKDKRDKRDKTYKSSLSNELHNSNKLKKEMLKRVKEYQKNKEIEKINNEKNESYGNSDFEDNDFEKEFNKSLNFLGNLAKKNKLKKNKTEKIKDNLEVNLNISNELNSQNNEPKYGCLKNGNKPTYNQYNNKTRKNDERIKIALENNTYDNNTYDNNTLTSSTTKNSINTISITNNTNNTNNSNNTNNTNNSNNTNNTNNEREIGSIINEIETEIAPINIKTEASNTETGAIKLDEILKNVNNDELKTNVNKDDSFIDNINNRKNEIIHLENENIINTNNNINNTISNNINIPKINRITRKKKFLLGKNKIKNRIGVLLKNRQTQKNIKEEIALLKKKDIISIKNYLNEKNLIKKGSDAPNDVLRKLYEDSVLSGNVNNLNNNNLVFNYLTA